MQCSRGFSLWLRNARITVRLVTTKGSLICVFLSSGATFVCPIMNNSLPNNYYLRRIFSFSSHHRPSSSRSHRHCDASIFIRSWNQSDIISLSSSRIPSSSFFPIVYSSTRSLHLRSSKVASSVPDLTRTTLLHSFVIAWVVLPTIAPKYSKSLRPFVEYLHLWQRELTSQELDQLNTPQHWQIWTTHFYPLQPLLIVLASADSNSTVSDRTVS